MAISGLLITPDGACTDVVLQSDAVVADLQRLVGGAFDLGHYRDRAGKLAVCAAVYENSLDESPVNMPATRAAEAVGHRLPYRLHGPAVFVGWRGEDLVSLTAETYGLLRGAALGQAREQLLAQNAQMLELLRLTHAALDVPYASSLADERARASVLDNRIVHLVSALSVYLNNRDREVAYGAGVVAQVAESLERYPATRGTPAAAEAEGGGQ